MQMETNTSKKASISDMPCRGLPQRHLSLQRSINFYDTLSFLQKIMICKKKNVSVDRWLLVNLPWFSVLNSLVNTTKPGTGCPGQCSLGLPTIIPGSCPCWLQQAGSPSAWTDPVLQVQGQRMVFTVFLQGLDVLLPFDSYSAMVGSVNAVPVSFGSSSSHKAYIIFPMFGMPIKRDPLDRLICTWWWPNSEACFQDFSSERNCCRGCQAPVDWPRRQSLSTLHPPAGCNAQTHTKGY